MPRPHHHTDAFVLKTLPKGEASKMIVLFTRDFGLIYARAQGIRKQKSKMRMHLEEGSRLKVSLVRGKEEWRVVGAEKLFSVFSPLLSKSKRGLSARLFALLSRLLAGTEPHKELFTDLDRGLTFLAHEELAPSEIESLEIVLVLKALFHLGYLSGEGPFANYLTHESFDRAVLAGIPEVRKAAVNAINSAFAESHL